MTSGELRSPASTSRPTPGSGSPPKLPTRRPPSPSPGRTRFTRSTAPGWTTGWSPSGTAASWPGTAGARRSSCTESQIAPPGRRASSVRASTTSSSPRMSASAAGPSSGGGWQLPAGASSSLSRTPTSRSGRGWNRSPGGKRYTDREGWLSSEFDWHSSLTSTVDVGAPRERMLHIIVNPASGNGAAGRAWYGFATELARRGYSFEVRFTERRGDAVEFSRDYARRGVETVNEIGNGLLDDDRPISPVTRLAIASVGTGKDLVRTLGTRKPAQMLDALDAGQCIAIDVGRLRFFEEGSGAPASRYFVN